MRNTPLMDAIREEMQRHAVAVTFEMGGKHPRAVFDVGGRPRRYAFSGSPSDSRAVRNVIADIRRILRGWENVNKTKL